jgi:hypothetical protein
VPFVRFSRDSRGYEHLFVVEPVTGRKGRTRQRVLYWFRTPPNVRVGRDPFDEPTIRALEAQYPNVRFDWEKIRSTKIPPVLPEQWRERRLAERAARQAREAEERVEPVATDGPTDAPANESPQQLTSPPAPESRRSRRRRRRREARAAVTAGSRPVDASEAKSAPADFGPPSSLSIESDETGSPPPTGDLKTE